jgi:hypothetical protein
MDLGWKPCRQTSRTVRSLPIMGRPRQIRWQLERIVVPRIITLSLIRDLSLSILTLTPNRIGYTWIWLAYSRDRQLLPPSHLRKILYHLIPILGQRRRYILSKRWGWSPYHRWSSNRKLCPNHRLCSNWNVSGNRKLNRTTLSTNGNLQVWCNGWYSATRIRIAGRKLRECPNKTGNRVPRKRRTTWRTGWSLQRCWNKSIQQSIQRMVSGW